MIFWGNAKKNYKIEVNFWRRTDKWIEWILMRQSKIQKKKKKKFQNISFEKKKEENFETKSLI